MRSSYSSLIQRDTFHYHILQPGVCGLVLWSGSDHDPENKKRQKRDQLETHSDHSTSGQSGIRHLRLSAAAEKTEQNTADGREAP